MKLISVLALMVLLSSCASLKKSFCNCDCDSKSGRETKMSSSAQTTASHAERTKISVSEKGAPAKEASIVVDSDDIEAGNRMSKAVDAFVFKNQKDDFTALCKDTRFDCFVNDKRYPKGRKKVKRKVPPFLSGSKMGLQGETRVRVKYDFYP